MPRPLTALLGVLQGDNTSAISDLRIGASAEEGGHDLLVAPRSVAENQG